MSDATQLGDLNDELINSPVWSDELVQAAGIPMVDKPLVTIGGGLGSLTLVEYLKVAGVTNEQIGILSDLDRPNKSYQYLCNNSQIPLEQRIRSDAGSVLDNCWGWPSYALREAAEDKSLKPLWTVGTEPVIAEYFTPRLGQVMRSVDRETARLDWSSMLVLGQVRMVRKRHGGGYFTILTPQNPGPTKRVAYRSTYVHIGVGYPGVKFLDDLQEYRDRYEDFTRVVNAYEPHPHVYEECKRRPCTVLVRGSGIVGSRVLQRLLDDREQHGAQTTVVHLFRNYVSGPQGNSPLFRRPGGEGWAYQGFNYVKSAWGGQMRDRIQKLEGQDRADLIHDISGTNTAPRKYWQKQLKRAAAGGWYVQRLGEVDHVEPAGDGMIKTLVRTREGEEYAIDATFIIDATGLEGDIAQHRVYDDLLRMSGANRNASGRLDTEWSFEVRGTRNDPGRLFASGSATSGGYFAGVDSFLGLQYVGLQITDELARVGFCKRIGPVRSVRQWLKWMRNKRP
jgi:hypothetical protein